METFLRLRIFELFKTLFLYHFNILNLVEKLDFNVMI